MWCPKSAPEECGAGGKQKFSDLFFKGVSVTKSEKSHKDSGRGSLKILSRRQKP